MAPNELLILHHTHVDIGYTHPQEVAWSLHDRYLDEVIDLCEKTAGYPQEAQMKWTCEVTSVALHWLKTASQDQVERMRKLVAEGRVEFGAMYLHWTALHQEDLLRESLLPARILEDELGAKICYAMQTDVNGIPWSATDMLLDAGIEAFMMSVNIHMGGYPLSRPLVFRWETPSGRELKVFSGEHYNAFTRETTMRQDKMVGAVQDERFLKRMEAGLEDYFRRMRQKGWKHDFAVLTATHPCMDDNGPPNPDLPELVKIWNGRGNGLKLRLVSLSEMFERIGRLENTSLPLHRGDWTDYWSNGVGASALEVTLSRRGHGALWASRALGTVLPSNERRKRAERDALDSLHLANEHTWNVFASTGALGVGGSGRIEPVAEAEQRHYKSARCADSLTFSRMARRDALDELAGNPRQATSTEGLLIFNPSELVRRVCLSMPKELVRGNYHLVGGTKHRLDVVEEVLTGTPAAVLVGPIEVPPMSYLSLALDDLPVGEWPGGEECGEGWVESPFWRLEYDPVTGAVLSLKQMVSGRECFDVESGYDLFGPIQESVANFSEIAVESRDPRLTFFAVPENRYDDLVHSDGNAWQPDWKARLSRPTRANRVLSRVDREGVHFERWVSFPGVLGEMHQTITLPRDEDRVKFTAFFNKADIAEPDSLYFSFPFQMPSARAHFDTAGVVLEYDKEQLPGASRGWITAGSMVAIENEEASLTLACPDAPLFQFGGLHYARDLQEVKGLNLAHVFAWPMNNYWNTNFRAAQPGLIRLRYELSMGGVFDAAESSRFAAAVARPVMYHPVVDLHGSAESGRLITGLPREVSIVSLKAEESGDWHVVFRNHGAEECVMSPRFARGEAKVIERVDPYGRLVESFSCGKPVHISPRCSIGLRVRFQESE